MNLCDLGLSNSFLNTVPKAQGNREKNSKFRHDETKKPLCLKQHYQENKK